MVLRPDRLPKKEGRKEGKEEEERNKAPPSNHEFEMEEEEERRFVRLLRREIDRWMDGEQAARSLPFAAAGTLALLTHAA